MRIKHYSPNFSFSSLLKALVTPQAEAKLISFFKIYTNKKFIILTNSCRSALYLTYKCLGKNGIVVTNPLTCNVALDPIVATGNRILYTDIEKDNLTMLTSDLNKFKYDNVIAIQAIHLGGFLCNMREIKRIAASNGIYIIEDCAQGFLSSYEDTKPGDYSDVVCFSLIKNAYGIGGGILATDNPEIYQRAIDMMQSFKKASYKLIFFRIVRNLIESVRDIKLFDFLYISLMKGRRISGDFKKRKDHTYYDILPSKLEMKIGYVQISKAAELNSKRKFKAGLLMKKLNDKGLICNYKDISGYDSAYTKFFMVNQNIKSEEFIKELNNIGIEARHLEHKYCHFYQVRIDLSGRPEMISNILNCHNYLELYDKIISLPLVENMSEETMDRIIEILIELIGE